MLFLLSISCCKYARVFAINSKHSGFYFFRFQGIAAMHIIDKTLVAFIVEPYLYCLIFVASICATIFTYLCNIVDVCVCVCVF